MFWYITVYHSIPLLVRMRPLQILYVLFRMILRGLLLNKELSCICFARYVSTLKDSPGRTCITDLVNMEIPGPSNFYVVWELIKCVIGNWSDNALLEQFISKIAKSTQSPIYLTKRYLAIERRHLNAINPPDWWICFMNSSIDRAAYKEGTLFLIVECVIHLYSRTKGCRRGTKRNAYFSNPPTKRICLRSLDIIKSVTQISRKRSFNHSTPPADFDKRLCVSIQCSMCMRGDTRYGDFCGNRCETDFNLMYEK